MSAGGDSKIEAARRVVEMAWRDLPAPARRLLENIGASSWQVTDKPLGQAANDLLRSAGHQRLTASTIAALDQAGGIWLAELSLVLINAAHPALDGLDVPTHEAMLARVAWHEWGHALSVVRATADDRHAGEHLLALAPEGIMRYIRGAGYRRADYTTELIAEIYALLMARRRRGQTGKPPWLADELDELVRRVTGWNE